MTANTSIGMDGCGDMAKYNGPAYIDVDTSNIISAGFNIPTITTSDGKRLFEEPNMASALNQRTILLVVGKESKPIVRVLWGLLDNEAKILKENPITIRTDEGEEIQISINLIKSQCDGKIEKMTQGRMSAFCLLCNATRDDAHDVDKIKAGFPMDISTREINERFNLIKEMQNKARMDLLTLQGYDDAEAIDFDEYSLDYKKIPIEERLSLTEKPMVQELRVANFLAALHCRLRSFGWVTDVMMRQCAGKTTYHKAVKKEVKDKFDDVKKKFREDSRTVFGTQMLRFWMRMRMSFNLNI